MIVNEAAQPSLTVTLIRLQFLSSQDRQKRLKLNHLNLDRLQFLNNQMSKIKFSLEETPKTFIMFQVYVLEKKLLSLINLSDYCHNFQSFFLP